MVILEGASKSGNLKLGLCDMNGDGENSDVQTSWGISALNFCEVLRLR